MLVCVCVCVCACVCVQCSDQPGHDSTCVQQSCPFGVLFCVGVLRLSTWLLGCLLCMGAALAHPALLFALCVSYLLFVWLCFVLCCVPCAAASHSEFVCFVCDALVHFVLACVFVLCVQGVWCL